MNKETQRIILASILITLVAYFYPNFWYVNNAEVNPENNENQIINNNITDINHNDSDNIIKNKNSLSKNQDNIYAKKTFNIKNNLYYATLSNESGFIRTIKLSSVIPALLTIPSMVPHVSIV